MSEVKLKNEIIVGDYQKPYIVAEINTSHFGDMLIAKKMIDKAKEIGCDCVKFQSWSTESLYSKTYYDENPIAKRFVIKLSFTEDQLTEVSQYCNKIGIDFASTPYSKPEVGFLAGKGNAPYIKIASMDLTNYPYLEYIARTDMPIVLSTGMGEMEEIEKAVKVIEGAGNKKIIILHCISIYPPKISTIQLNNILGLRDRFPNYPIGFSDHSIGTEIAAAAVALGAALIEKHFTLDKSRIGMDNQMATEPEEFAQLVRQCHNVQLALGNKERSVLPAELTQREKMRRSIVVTRDISAGETIMTNDLDAKRPGTGILPERIPSLIGKKLKRDVKKDTLIQEEDI